MNGESEGSAEVMSWRCKVNLTQNDINEQRNSNADRLRAI